MKPIFAFIIMALFATNVFASKSRVESLAQPTNGTWVFEDARNIFLNPAHLLKLNDSLTMEWGSSTTTTDSTGTPKAEGTLIQSIGNGKLAVTLGDEVESTISLRRSVSTSFLTPENTIHAIYAFNAGNIPLGILVERSSNKTETGVDKDEKTLAFRVGANFGEKTSATLTYAISDEATGALLADDKIDLSGSLELGVNYNINSEMNVYGSLSKADADIRFTSSDYGVNVEVLSVGFARKKQFDDNGFFFYQLGLRQQSNKNTVSNNKETYRSMPLVFGAERRANSWLTFRGAVGQAILLNDYESTTGATTTTDTLDDSSFVRAGSSIEFNKNLKVDSSLSATSGTVTANNLMTRVSVLYNF